MRWVKALAGFAIGTFGSVSIGACETGDTTIKATFRLATTRVRPTPRVAGTDNSFVIVLKPDRSVSEQFTSSGEKPVKATGSQVLGEGRFRVVGENSIERVISLDTHIERVTIRVTGHTCSASWAFELKPGQTEYKLYSTQLGQNAYYSRVATVNSTCSIR